MSETTDDIEQLTDRVIDQLEPGFYDGKLVLSRRQAIALTGTTFSAAALMGVGFGSAEAQAAAGQVGTDAEPIDVFGATVDSNEYTLGGSPIAQSIAASGSVALSGGTATVDTGLSDASATFYLALGVDDPAADVNLAGKLFWDDTAGTYKVTIDEVDTEVGNPTANYDVLRVR